MKLVLKLGLGWTAVTVIRYVATSVVVFVLSLALTKSAVVSAQLLALLWTIWVLTDLTFNSSASLIKDENANN